MRTGLLLFFLFVFLQVSGQASFPESWAGNWKGELIWTKTGTSAVQRVPMQLLIQPADSADSYTWQLIYGEANTDNRPYILRPVNKQEGHWVVDENNGIILDQYWTGGRLSGMFTVMQSTIFNSYRIERDTLFVDMTTLATKAVSRTGKGTEESPFVDSYQVRAMQTAILTRQ